MSEYENRKLVFTVRTQADCAMGHVYLDENGLHHTLTGHRELKNMVHLGIQPTAERPTEIWQSRTHINRFVFVSRNILTHRGKPMGVIVEREHGTDRGRIVTATPVHAKWPKNLLIYDETGKLFSSYDEDSDLLYLTKGDPVEAFADESDDPRLWFRYSDSDDRPIGVTVFDLRSYWADKLPALVEQISKFLHVIKEEISPRVQCHIK